MALVLVIDDTPDLLYTIAELVKVLGYVAVTATSGARGLEILEESKPDLVLTDVRMPIMNGLDFTRQAKAVRPELPVVLVSAEPEKNLQDFVRDCGADG